MNPLHLLDLYLDEDCPYFDETAELLRIQGEGTMKILTREDGVSACTEELVEWLKLKGLSVEFLPSGIQFGPGDAIIVARGILRTLFKVWRVSQTLLSITSGIATATEKLVRIARRVNPNVIIATTRKTHPGMRYFELKAVRAGGGTFHRNSLSDSILITQNHLRVSGEPPEFETLRSIEIEPSSAEGSLSLALKADLLLLDHSAPEELRGLVPKLRKINPKVRIAVAGDINETNIGDYAQLADIIITSSPYYAKPLNLTTKIERM